MTQPHRYVSISRRAGRNGRPYWRIAAKHFRGWNDLDLTLAEDTAKTEQVARRIAQRYAREYGAEIIP